MLCGRVPFEFNGKPITSLPSPADSDTWAPACLKILKRATADEVVHRYGSVAEFWSELAALATYDPAATQALPFKPPTPEDSELAKKRAELAPLAAILAQRELELATLQVELREFEARYLRIVGVRYTRLDEIEEQIAGYVRPCRHASRSVQIKETHCAQSGDNLLLYRYSSAMLTSQSFGVICMIGNDDRCQHIRVIADGKGL